jgi:hypothetical protein
MMVGRASAFARLASVFVLRTDSDLQLCLARAAVRTFKARSDAFPSSAQFTRVFIALLGE